MSEVLNQLSQFPVKTRLSLTGTLIVARDIAHAKLLERLEEGRGLPEYFKDHPVYYAGPAKTPEVRCKLCMLSSCCQCWYTPEHVHSGSGPVPVCKAKSDYEHFSTLHESDFHCIVVSHFFIRSSV